MSASRTRMAVAFTTALVFAACSRSGGLTTPDNPRFDGGGHTFGGGNKVDSITTTTSGQDGAINAGGHTFGGGN